MSAPGHKRVNHDNHKDDWVTPNFLWYKIHDIFDFNLDAAASKENTKCERFFSGPCVKGLETTCFCGLCSPWKDHTVWLNPPYGHNAPLINWTRKLDKELEATWVALLPNNTETEWFHQVWNISDVIVLLKGRVPFEGRTDNKPSQNSGGNILAIKMNGVVSPAPRYPQVFIWDWKYDPFPEEAAWQLKTS